MQIQPMRWRLPSLICGHRKPRDSEFQERLKYESRRRSATWRGELREPGPSRTGGSGVAGAPPPLGVRWLGRMNFADALQLQEKVVAQKRNDPNVADTILLLEHDP